MTADPWLLPLPQDLPGFPPSAARELQAAFEEGRHVDHAERDRIIRAAGADPAEWRGEALAQKANRWKPVVAREETARAQRKREDRIKAWKERRP